MGMTSSNIEDMTGIYVLGIEVFENLLTSVGSSFALPSVTHDGAAMRSAYFMTWGKRCIKLFKG
jgi:hypothetical protein